MIRYNPNINEGLNINQVQYRKKYNYVNTTNDIEVDSFYKIVFTNLVSIFNILNLYIAVLFFIERSYLGFIFIFIILLNTLLHIIKEVRTKIIIDKFNKHDSLVSVIRDSKTICINKKDIVLDDIIVYKNNDVVATDSIILEGSILVDESCLNGKNPKVKTTGEMVYTGSTIINGKCICRAEKIGNNNYLSKIINITKNKNNTSSIKRVINNIIKYVSIIVIILSIIIYMHTKSLTLVVTYIYKIVPIELVLLSTISFLLNVIKLKRSNILVRNFKSIESSSNIDTICFDKTGTLTKNNLVLEDVVVLNKKYDYINILSAIGKYCNTSNNLINIIHKKYNKKTNYDFINEESFDNYIKINFKGHKYLLGDPKILDDSIDLSNYNGYKVELLKTEKDSIALLLLSYEIELTFLLFFIYIDQILPLELLILITCYC